MTRPARRRGEWRWYGFVFLCWVGGATALWYTLQAVNGR
jgi:hypothetical protein